MRAREPLPGAQYGRPLKRDTPGDFPSAAVSAFRGMRQLRAIDVRSDRVRSKLNAVDLLAKRVDLPTREGVGPPNLSRLMGQKREIRITPSFRGGWRDWGNLPTGAFSPRARYLRMRGGDIFEGDGILLLSVAMRMHSRGILSSYLLFSFCVGSSSPTDSPLPNFPRPTRAIRGYRGGAAHRATIGMGRPVKLRDDRSRNRSEADFAPFSTFRCYGYELPRCDGAEIVGPPPPPRLGYMDPGGGNF